MRSFKKVAFSLSIGLLFATTSIHAAQTSGVYKNQRGSLLVLNWNPNYQNTGTLTGTFTTAVGNCMEDVGVPMPIAGYYNGNAISITVNFPHCKQTVAMTGHVSQDQTTIHTLWLDAKQASDPSRKDWEANIAGADYYQKQG